MIQKWRGHFILHRFLRAFSFSLSPFSGVGDHDTLTWLSNKTPAQPGDTDTLGNLRLVEE